MLWPFLEAPVLDEFRNADPVQPGSSPQGDTPSTQLMDDLSSQTKKSRQFFGRLASGKHVIRPYALPAAWQKNAWPGRRLQGQGSRWRDVETEIT